MDYRREIDGLRALALIPVILFHAGINAFSGGYIGVDVFFVISGYLITSIILAEKATNTFTLTRFYERRARRILPALLLVMLACLPFAWQWLLPKDMQEFSHSLVAVPVFTSNILFWRESGYFDTAAELKPLLHTWSLAIEEQYYLLFPLFMIATWRLGKRKIALLLLAIATVSLTAAEWGSLHKPAATFFLLPTRGWELAIGALLAFYSGGARTPRRIHPLLTDPRLQQAASLSGIAIILLSIYTYDKSTPFPGKYALAPTIGTALIILFAYPHTLAGRILGSKPLVNIGLISYSAYLWHQPLFAFARYHSITKPSLELMLSLSGISLILAWISWRYVETPCRDSAQTSIKTILILASVGSLIFICVGFIGHHSNGYESRFNQEEFKTLIAVENNRGLHYHCHAHENEYIKPEASCRLGATHNIHVALIGDSHSIALTDELEKSLTRANLGFRTMTYSSCPPALDVYNAVKKENHQCRKYNQEVMNFIRQNKSLEYIIILARWSAYLDRAPFNNQEGGAEPNSRMQYADTYEHGIKQIHDDKTRKSLVLSKYAATIQAYLNTGKKIILVYPIPEAGWNVPQQLAKLYSQHGPLNHASASTRYEVFLERSEPVNTTFDHIPDHPNLTRIKPEKILCNTYAKDRCVVHLNGYPLYYDDNHVSNAGAHLIITRIVNQIIHKQETIESKNNRVRLTDLPLTRSY